MADKDFAEMLDPQLTVRPGAVVDLLSSDEGTVVLVRDGVTHRVVRLSVLGAEVLHATGRSTTLAALERELRRRLGEPPTGDLAALMAAALRSLADQGVVNLQDWAAGDAQS